MSREKVNGHVSILGAGPGDPALLTLKGREKLETADCIIYDRLASPELLAWADRDCEFIYVGKKNHHHTMKQDAINELMLQKALEGKSVVRLKGGDPYVFGRGGEEAIFLTEHGISVEVIPGISSVISVLEDAGIPITHRGLSKGFQVVTAHSRKDRPADIDYSQLLDPDITYVFLMGLAHVGEIAENLVKAGRSADTPAAVIARGTTARQKKCTGTLADIGRLTEAAGLESPATIVVGETVRLSEKLSFFEKRPLFGRKFLVPYIERLQFTYGGGLVPERINTHFSSELETGLREAGADVIPLKVGKIRPVKIEKNQLDDALAADWLVFTSPNGVRSLMWNLREYGMDIRSLGNARLATVGKSSARTLAENGLIADYIPEDQNSDALAAGLLERATGKVTLFAAEKSSPGLIQALSEHLDFTKIVCYRNEPVTDSEGRGSDSRTGQAGRLSGKTGTQGAEGSGSDVIEKAGRADGIFFTSASSARRTLAILGELPAGAEVYSIGPKCSEGLRRAGVTGFAEAAESSYRGLLDLVIRS